MAEIFNWAAAKGLRELENAESLLARLVELQERQLHLALEVIASLPPSPVRQALEENHAQLTRQLLQAFPPRKRCEGEDLSACQQSE